MAREVTNHGQSGYRRGHRCEVCRAGHRQAVADWRAARRAAAAPPEPDAETPAPAPVTVAGALDLGRDPGPLEQALLEDLDVPDAKVPFRRHLVGLARLNARVLDQIAELDRYDLISSVQLRQLEILTRIARLGFNGLDDDKDGGTVRVPDDASEILAELEQGDA